MVAPVRSSESANDGVATARKLQVSVVITTRDRADRLELTLASLAAQEVGDIWWELILIDNGSTDHTADVIEAAARTLPIRAFHVATPGKTRAQNAAIKQVQGALVVFTDDDVRFAPRWLANLYAAACVWPDADLFGGSIEPQLVDTPPSWLDSENGRAIIDRHCGRYAPRSDEGYTDKPPMGANMALRRRILVGADFDENVGPDGSPNYIKGGDTDLNQAFMDQGLRCVFVPAARVLHGVDADQLALDALFRGGYRRGRKNAYLYPKRSGFSVCGAPLKLWVKLFKQWSRYRLSVFSGPVARYDTGLKYHYRRGYLYQLRRHANMRSPTD